MKQLMKTVLLTLSLALLALVGNLVSVHLFFGIDFIFGSIAVMMAVAILGTVPAIIVAICGGLYTLVLWHHPYALITFTVEALVVSRLYQRGQSNLVLADTIFWLTLGIPQILIYYLGPIGMSWDNVQLIAIKQPINGIFNALIASLILIFCQRIKDRKALQYMDSSEISKLLFHALLAIILLVGSVPIIYDANHSQKTSEKLLEKQLLDTALSIKTKIEQQKSSSPESLQTLLQTTNLSEEMGLTGFSDGLVIASKGHEILIGDANQRQSIGDFLQHIAPTQYNSAMQRWLKGQYSVQIAVADQTVDRIAVTHQAEPIIKEIKDNSLTFFILLCLITAFGILVAIMLSRILSGLLTRLARVASETSNAVVITNTAGQVEWVNEGFYRITGYNLRDMLGQKPGSLLQGPKTNPQTVAEISRCIAQREPFNGELINYTKEGKEYWVHLLINPLHGPRGELQGFMAIETDVTDRKSIELELLDFKKTLDQTLDCVFMFDADTLRFTYANAGAMKQIGYSQEEIFQMYPYDIKPDFTAEQFKELVTPMMTQGKSQSFMTIHQHKNGQQIPVEIFLQYIAPHDQAAHFVAIVRDISQQLKIQTELHDQANRIRAIVENMVDAVITIDEQGIIDSFNPAAERIFGYQTDEVAGQNVKMLVPSPHKENHDNYLKNYQRTGEAKIIGIGREVEGRRKDGSLFPMELAVSEATHLGRPMYVGLVRDITERKRLERLKSEFVSTVSHELRTPLTSIRGSIGLLIGKAGDQIDGKLRSLLELAQRNTDRLTLLINDLLDLEKIESGRMNFDFQELDLVTLAKRSLEDNMGYAKQHNVRLKLETKLDEAIAYGDEHRLLQVMANLISNAIKFSPSETPVTISIIDEPASAYYSISVKDQGSGIPDEFRDRIFQRFAQADSSDTREKGGTGLGLSISKAIIDSHQGIIDYDSKVGQGTEFYFKLKARPRVTLETPTGDGQPKVLICEDDHDFVSVLTEILSNEGVVCDVAPTLAEARKLLAQNYYAVLLLDLQLPDGDGFELLEEIRDDQTRSALPVIIISGQAEERQNKTKTEFLEVADWLQKPLNEQRLSRALQEAVQKNTRPHILHIEDDLGVVEMVQALVDNVADFSYATSLEKGQKMLIEKEFDLVILDLGLDNDNGAQLLDLIKRKCPVLIFSAQNPSNELVRSVNLALTKSMTTNDELLKTIKQLLTRD